MPISWGELREVERENGRLLSFFADEAATSRSRPRKSRRYGPMATSCARAADRSDKAALTSTVWMSGVFNSMLTQGHVGVNRFWSTTHSYLGLFRSHGQRLFVDDGNAWRLLDGLGFRNDARGLPVVLQA